MVSFRLMRQVFNSSRERLLQENAAFALTIPAGALVLDAGAGTSPYKPLFSHVRYESADFEQVDKPYAQQTYTCDSPPSLSRTIASMRFCSTR